MFIYDTELRYPILLIMSICSLDGEKAGEGHGVILIFLTYLKKALNGIMV